jgi:hypothetical protein
MGRENGHVAAKDMNRVNHPIPDAALSTASAIVGRTGSGKTFTAKGAAEALLEQQRRVCIVDPTGAWWGLRLLADGKAPSPFSVVIVGGDHGDVPLDASMGKQLGALIASGRLAQCVVDVSDFSNTEAVRFLTDFFEELYRANKGALHLILDEADMMAPQNPLPEQRRLQGAVNKIVRRGRIKGFRPMMLTQRPQVIDKSVLSQVDTLIALRLQSPQDRKAIEEWVKGHAADDEAKRVLSSLAGLKVGEGFIWSPSNDLLERVQFPKISTFDSSRAPEPGEEAVETTPLKIDLGELRELLTPASDEAEKISAARKGGTPTSAEQLQQAERKGYDWGYEVGLRRGGEWAANQIRHLGRLADDILTEAERLVDEATSGRWALDMEMKNPAPRPAPMPAGSPAPADPRSAGPAREDERPARTPKAAVASAAGNLTPSLQRVLNAIGWWRKIGVEPVERARACVVAGYSPKASTFGVYIADLASRGLVATPVPGKVQLTPAGLAHAEIPDAATREDLYRVARSLLKPQEARVFDVIYNKWPQSIRRVDVAERLGLSPTASTTGVYISAVAAFGIIETSGPGQVRAADWLFPEIHYG